MGLESYDELREKVVNQMHEKTKELKTIMVVQWAKDNSFGDVAFENYDEAQKWVKENVKGFKAKRSFNNFEAKTNDMLTSLMQDLEAGSSSEIMRMVKHASDKVVIPAAKFALKSIIVSQATHMLVHAGLVAGGNLLHGKALDALDSAQQYITNFHHEVDFANVDLTSKVASAPKRTPISIPRSEVREGAWGVLDKVSNFGKGVGENVVNGLSGAKDIVKEKGAELGDTVANFYIDGAENLTQDGVNVGEDAIHAAGEYLLEGVRGKELALKDSFDNVLVPVISKYASIAAGVVYGKSSL